MRVLPARSAVSGAGTGALFPLFMQSELFAIV
jgi:hypothetical protein